MAAFFLLLFSLSLLFSPSLKAEDFPSGKVIDLTHPFEEQTLYWPTEKGFVLEKGSEGITDLGYFYAANRFCAPEHGGTHLDAPHHFSKEGETVDQIPLSRLMGKAIVVDVSAEVLKNRDYQIRVEDFQKWEKKGGRIPSGAIVLLRTGYGRFWPDRGSYMGTDRRGKGAVSELHFPGLGPRAARWLAEQRGIKAVGLDTPSIDHGPSRLFQAHRALSAKNIPVFENLSNLEELPLEDFFVIALPMKIKGGSGGPLRIVAILPPLKSP